MLVASLLIDVVHACGRQLNQLELWQAFDDVSANLDFIGDDDVGIFTTLNNGVGVFWRVVICDVVTHACWCG